jgi:hypothetical protein
MTYVPPAWVLRTLETLRSAMFSVYQALLPGPVNLLEMIGSAWFAQAITAAAELGIADTLTDGPRTADEIAALVGADADAVERLLRLLASRKVFSQQRDGRFRLTRNARALLRDSPTSVHGFALFVGSPEHREHWSRLTGAIRDGGPVVPALRGDTFFGYLESNRPFATVFDAAMASTSALTMPMLLAAHDFTRYSVIADIGGGQGHFLAEVLSRARGIRGILFDVAAVTDQAPARLADHGVAGRCTIENGSFFGAVPAARTPTFSSTSSTTGPTPMLCGYCAPCAGPWPARRGC